MVFFTRFCMLIGLLYGSGGLLIAAEHKVQVQDPSVAAQLANAGARLLADYGKYKLFAAEDAAAQAAAVQGADFKDDYNQIHLNAHDVDTSRPEMRMAKSAATPAFKGKRMHLVHFVGPIQPSWRQELVEAGLQVIAYLPENAYLVYGNSSALAKVKSRAATDPHIQWEGAYLDDYRIHPGAKKQDAAGNPREIGTELFAVQLVADSEANPDTLQLLDRLKLEPFQRQEQIGGFLNVVLRLPPDEVTNVSAQPDVISIQPYFPPNPKCERQDQIIAGNLAGNVPAGPGYLAWLESKGFSQAQFTASGFVVDVTDSGIDNGTVAPNHFGLHVNGAVAGASRVSYARLVGTPNSGSTLKGCDGHGALNAHIVGGYADLNGFPFTDVWGYHYGLGVCPYVKLGSSVIFDPNNFTNPNYKNLISQAYQSGARISNNSWGGNGTGVYDIDSQTYDSLVRDAQPSGSTYSVPGNQEMVIVFAAGNEGSGPHTVDPPGTGKNVITVGAAEGVQAFGSADGSGISDSGADNANDIVSFSSRGPCVDGRHKPDLVAPGTHISGGVVQVSNPGAVGQADGCYTGGGVSGGAGGASFFPAGQQFYTASSGTSHATPAVSGACALLRQYFLNHFTNAPSPAMTKAYLLNSTRYLTGSGANDNLWSDSQGMGELNLGTAFDGTSRLLRDQMPTDLFTASGQSRVFTGTIADSSKPFRVTLAWTDAPGSTSGNAYNNNLDLTVTVNGKTYKGNVFSGAYSTNNCTADLRNNVESVYLPAGLSGTVQITVLAANINSDGVPNNAYTIDQDFALVGYNLEGDGQAVISPEGATLVGETCPPGNGAADPGEVVTFRFGLRNIGVTNTSELTATLLNLGGITYPGAVQSYGNISVGGTASRDFTFTPVGNCGTTVRASLLLQDSGKVLGTVSFDIPLGKMETSTTLAQNFDAISAPAIPSGWSTAASGSASPWATTASSSDTAPNSAVVGEPDNIGVAELTSPALSISSANAQLSFRHRYLTEVDPYTSSLAYDGGVLEIKIGSAGYKDIILAGGSFVMGSYTRTIDASGDNPLKARQGWTGDSGGFITTTVALPASAVGQTVQFKWRFGTDTGNIYGGSGWWLDSIALTDASFACATPVANLASAQREPPEPQSVGGDFSYVITITNAGPGAAAGITITNVLPAGSLFISASAGLGQANGIVFGTLDYLLGGTQTNLTVTIAPPPSTTAITNVVLLSSATVDGNLLDNNSTNVFQLAPPAAPQITGFSLTSTNAALSFPSLSGWHYRLEYKDALSPGPWTWIPPVVDGDGGILTIFDPSRNSTGRFYRILIE